MGWKGLRDDLTGSGCSGPQPAWPWTLPGMGIRGEMGLHLLLGEWSTPWSLKEKQHIQHWWAEAVALYLQNQHPKAPAGASWPDLTPCAHPGVAPPSDPHSIWIFPCSHSDQQTSRILNCSSSKERAEKPNQSQPTWILGWEIGQINLFHSLMEVWGIFVMLLGPNLLSFFAVFFPQCYLHTSLPWPQQIPAPAGDRGHQNNGKTHFESKIRTKLPVEKYVVWMKIKKPLLIRKNTHKKSPQTSPKP